VSLLSRGPGTDKEMSCTILGLEAFPPARCFVELRDAIDAIQTAGGDRRHIVLNAHHKGHIPSGSIVYNFENVPLQVDPARFAGFETWDFSKRNAAQYGAKYVPVGYHPSMERFERGAEPDIDVVHVGCINARRANILGQLVTKGYRVMCCPPSVGMYGSFRDGLLSMAKLVVAPMFYEDGVFPALRAAHLVANRVPAIYETCDEIWPWLPQARYEGLVAAVTTVLGGRGLDTDAMLASFKDMPLVLPS
jgi:hypothetical protein